MTRGARARSSAANASRAQARRTRRVARRRRAVSDVVPGGLDGLDERGAIGDVGVIADRRHLRREVDRRAVDAGRLARNRSMRFTHDAQVIPSMGREISVRAVWRRVHTPWEYTIGVLRHRTAQTDGMPIEALTATDPRAVGTRPRRRHGDVVSSRWSGSGDRRCALATAPPARVRRGRRGRPTPGDDPSSDRRRRAAPRDRDAGPRDDPRRATPTTHCPPSTSPTDRPGTAPSSIAVAEIPWGETASYGEIARRIGSPGRSRGRRRRRTQPGQPRSSRAIGSSPRTGRSVATAATRGAAARIDWRSSATCSCAKASRSRRRPIDSAPATVGNRTVHAGEFDERSGRS